MKYRANTIENFHNKYVMCPLSGCWIWQDKLDKDGYGRFNCNYKKWRAHKFAYTFIVGEVPDGKQLDHKCRNRACVNPDHLEPVTCRENLMRGHTAASIAVQKTHCKRGHEFTASNTYMSGHGTRQCKQCGREKSLRLYHAKKAKS